MEEDGTANVRIFIAANVTVNDTFFPMIRKSTETDSSLIPYENSCPISGWTGLKMSEQAIPVLELNLLCKT